MSAPRILLAEDDASLRYVLSQALSKEGYDVRATPSLSALAKWVREGGADLVLSDVYLGDACVFDLLPTLQADAPGLPVLVMSAQATVTTALAAGNAGAYDYIAKPFDLDDLLAGIGGALRYRPPLARRAANATTPEDLPLVGRSPAMQEVFRVMARVMNADAPLLIQGETGVGKARAARTIHEHSKRARGSFVALATAGLDSLALERALSGDEGALRRARGGVLFIEGVDEAPLDAQARLASGVGEAASMDVRIIASVRRDLASLAQAGALRADLLYRLSVLTLRLPPLRERLQDLPELARLFLARAAREGLGSKIIDEEALSRLSAYAFPGNVRELENILLRAAALCPAGVIGGADIGRALAVAQPPDAGADGDFREAIGRRLEALFAGGPPAPGLLERLSAEVEAPLIARTLLATKGNQIKAAAILGLNRNTLRKKIQVLGIVTGRED